MKKFKLRRFASFVYVAVMAVLAFMYFTNDYGLVDIRKTAVNHQPVICLGQIFMDFRDSELADFHPFAHEISLETVSCTYRQDVGQPRGNGNGQGNGIRGMEILHALEQNTVHDIIISDDACTVYYG